MCGEGGNGERDQQRCGVNKAEALKVAVESAMETTSDKQEYDGETPRSDRKENGGVSKVPKTKDSDSQTDAQRHAEPWLAAFADSNRRH